MYWNNTETAYMLNRFGWIVTLDVLKCSLSALWMAPGSGWIVTLDVLKYAKDTGRLVLCIVE